MCAGRMWRSARSSSARRWSCSGGPSMLIGLGGGAASSVGSGQSSSDLDFASVQRGNAEIQRRAQEVIDRCWALGDANPILLIHDVGAGGLSNALPEAIAHSQRGGRIDLRKIPSAESELSPMEIWCNEAQERYVLALTPGSVAAVRRAVRARALPLCRGRRDHRGRALAASRSAVSRPPPVDMPIEVLLGKAPRMTRNVRSVPKRRSRRCSTAGATIGDSLDRLLRLPTIADKSFLITIGDRSVGGLSAATRWWVPGRCRSRMWPVSLSDFEGYGGEAMAMGERTPVALLMRRPPGGSPWPRRSPILPPRMSAASPMCACRRTGWPPAASRARMPLCMRRCARSAWSCAPTLGITIPVGKDSLSMRTAWTDASGAHSVLAPVSLIVSAFAPVADARRTLTPSSTRSRPSRSAADRSGRRQESPRGLAAGRRCSASRRRAGRPRRSRAAARVLRGAARAARRRGLLLAYHDRSDGGLLVTLLEMAFAATVASTSTLDAEADPIAACFAEEPGAVLQVPGAVAGCARDSSRVTGSARTARDIGAPRRAARSVCASTGASCLAASRVDLHRALERVSFRMQALRDNPECAARGVFAAPGRARPGPARRASASIRRRMSLRPTLRRGARPRGRGAARAGRQQPDRRWPRCSTRAGFDAYDVHMTDILARRARLATVPRPGGLRRILLRRRARRRRGLGQIDPVQSACARRVRGVLRARRDLHAGRVQRLPDARRRSRS